MKSHFLKKIVSLVLCLAIFICALTSNVFAATYEIDDWYVNDTSSRRFYLWNVIPSSVYVHKCSGMSDYFVPGVSNGVTVWRSELGIGMGSITTTIDDKIYNGIKVFGGNEAQLISLGIWNESIINDPDVFGYTLPTAILDQNNAYVIPYPSAPLYINVYITQSMNIFIKKMAKNDLAKYYHLGTHELGHALGWCGHTYDTESVMYYTGPTNLYTLSDIDVNHVKQFYD